MAILSKIGALGGLFSAKANHPLADAKELRAVLAGLQGENPAKILDEIAGWLESLRPAGDFPADRRFDVTGQLDEAVQLHLRRLTRDYVQAPRLEAHEERRQWALIHGVWQGLAAAYGQCLDDAVSGKGAERARPYLPLLCARLVAAWGAANKWQGFHYALPATASWKRLGQAYLLAEESGEAARPVQLYPQFTGSTSVAQEYLKAVIFQAASMDCLMPLEMELAEKLIAHFLPGFALAATPSESSIYWIDLGQDEGPRRRAARPGKPVPTLRFLQAGNAYAGLEALARHLEEGGDVPTGINLGGQYSARALLPVARHLAAQLGPVQPERRHDRHRVRDQFAVVPGFAHAQSLYTRTAIGLPTESWTVENVSRGGFGVADARPLGWVKIGTLVSLQPEGGSNWLLGIIRRCQRQGSQEIGVGIETLARQVVAVQVKPTASASFSQSGSVQALWLWDGGQPGEARLVLPFATFDATEDLELAHDGRRYMLIPVALEEQTPDYEVARYRILTAAA